MTTGIEQMLRAQLRDLNLQVIKHQRTILEQQETIAALNRQIAALGKVVENPRRGSGCSDCPLKLPDDAVCDYCP